MSSDKKKAPPRPARGILKWFDRDKGFGFVVVEAETSHDAFLHISLLKEQGLGIVDEGDIIDCQVVDGPKGLQVAEIERIERLPAAQRQQAQKTGPEVKGRVKFFDRRRCYGFIESDCGSDVYFTLRSLERGGMGWIDADQRVVADTVVGPKGLMADAVRSDPPARA